MTEAPTPARMVSEPLWMMHVIGPDDLYPAPDHATAVAWCAYLNREIAPKVPSVLCIAVPAIWTGTDEEHAEGLPEAIKGWTLPAAAVEGEAPTPLVDEPATLATMAPMTTHPTLRSANVARQKEWDQDGQITASYRGNELAGEVGEACNVIKKLERERLGIRGSRSTVDELADELADVVICADLIAMHYGIDLEAAIARKFNATSEKVGLATRLAAPEGEDAA